MSRGLNAMKVLADLENGEARFSIDMQGLTDLKQRVESNTAYSWKS